MGADQASERRPAKSPPRPGTSTATIPGSACCSAPRSSACGTGAPISTSSSGAGRQERNARPPRLDLRFVFEAAAGVHFHHPRHHLPRARQARQLTPALQPLVDANGNAIARESQAAFPLMVKHVLPEGIRGVVVAGLLAALMSSLAGAFNASSTLFTIDLYKKRNPNASDSRLVWVGRMATVAMTVIALIWIPVIRNAPRSCTTICRASKVISLRRFSWCSSSACSGSDSTRPAAWRRSLVGFLMGLFRLAVDTPITLGLERLRRWLHPRFVPLDRQQHLLPVLQPVDFPGLVGRDDRRELPDGRPVAGADPGPHLRHRDRGAEARNPRKLVHARRLHVGAS